MPAFLFVEIFSLHDSRVIHFIVPISLVQSINVSHQSSHDYINNSRRHRAESDERNVDLEEYDDEKSHYRNRNAYPTNQCCGNQVNRNNDDYTDDCGTDAREECLE